MKLSIIVPVYNTKDYLKKCLDSLVNQTLDDYEIIVVNDGSPDDSQKIIDEYVSKYPGVIKSYVKENGGLSDARNYGLKFAKGDYIGFVDSDDYVEENMFELLYNKAIEKSFDITVCDVNYIYENKNVLVSSRIENDTYDIKQSMIDIYPAAWNKIYKRALFENGVIFKKGVWYEDVEFLYRLFPYIKSIGVVKLGLYNYVQCDNSIIKTFDKRLYNYIDNFNGIIAYYKKNKFYDKYFDELEYCYTRYLLMTFIKGAANFSKDEYNNACLVSLENLENNFPNYKKNKYLKGIKKLYVKNFKFFKNIIYIYYHK